MDQPPRSRLDPDPEAMRRIGRAAVAMNHAHIERLPRAPVSPRYTSAELYAVVYEPLPLAGAGIEASLERFFDHLLPRCTLVNHPRFFAYIPGPGSWAGAVAEFAAAATNLFVGTWLGGAAMAQLEVQVLDWLRQALGLRAGVSGVLTSGGSVANLSALAAAAERAPAERGRAVVYIGDETHYSMAKAARVLGFGPDQVRRLPVGDDLRLSPAALAEAVAADRRAGRRPLFLCANAGSTTTGTIDPLDELADLCEREGLWLHVDAAYGGAAAMVPELRPPFAGLERADSVTLDPHKWLYCPFELGCVLTPHVDALRAAFTGDAEYMQDVPRSEVNFFERGPELSRGNRALKLWLLLRACGLEAIRAAVAEDVRLCRLACDLLRRDARFEVVTEPRLSVFTFAPRAGEAAGQALLERILRDGFLMLSSSRVRGRYVLRFCVANHRTQEDDVRAAVERVRELAEG
jgi:glutamate/tyrosine decarboxylase-like PLP-dependent enzyme